jgi:hypothetical protein
MLKIFSAIAAAALIAGAIVAFPGSSDTVNAGTPEAARKVDRLITEAAPACTQRGWPYYNLGCPQKPDGSPVRPVRLISTDRL